MKSYKFPFLCFSLLVLAFLCKAQTIKQFNGRINISDINYTGGSDYTIKGTFTDGSNTYNASDAAVGDQVVDAGGNTFLITEVSVSGPIITAKVQVMNAIGPTFGQGTIFRPTSQGFPLITNDAPQGVLVNSINTATLSIDAKLPRFDHGTTLPNVLSKVGDVVLYTGDSKIYTLTSSGWRILSESNIPTSYVMSAADLPPGSKGDLVKLYFDNYRIYTYNGSSWILPSQVSALPTPPKYGDFFHVTSENRLYMYSASGNWVSIGGGVKPGNTLPPSGDAKPGDTFYHTTENRLYVYNGTEWVPTDNTLANGQFYVGNASGIAEATEKSAIAISGFDEAAADVSMGDGTNNFKITSLADPVSLNDAATKSYVDLKTSDAGSITLANGNILVGNASDKATAVAKNTIPLNDLGAATAPISLGNHGITNLADPSSAQDAATKNYVDTRTIGVNTIALANGNILVGDASDKATAVAKNTIRLSDLGPANAPVSLGNNILTDLAEPSTGKDAATKGYVDTKIIDPGSISLTTGDLLIGNASGKAGAMAKNTVPISGFGNANEDVSIGNGTSNYRVTNVADPTADQDAATKKYVDSKLSDLSSLTLTDGKLYIGNNLNQAVEQAIVGDVTVSNTGQAMIANEAVSAEKIKAASVTVDKLATAGTGDANKVYMTDAQGVPILADKSTFGVGGETFAEDFVVKGVPNYLKWTNGQTVPAKGKTAIQLLLEGSQMAVAPTYVSPTTNITGSPAAGSFEYGQNLGTITLTSSFTQNDAGALTGTTYKKNGTALSGNTDIISSLTSPVTYTVTKTYAEGAVKNNNLGDADPSGRIPAGSVTSTITYTPVASRYYGFVSSPSPTDAEVLGLTKDQVSSKVLKTTLTNPTTPKYICFRYPAGPGALTAIKVNGFSSFGAFTITQSSFTNAQGYQSSYYLVIGNNPVDNSGASSTDLDFQ